jgi:hypothetical protein
MRPNVCILGRILGVTLLSCVALAVPGCGDEIGDSCSISSDCAREGNRLCDRNQPGGYCTIAGCDHGTCPDEAVCVRFFPAGLQGVPCDPATEDQPSGTDACGFDEHCTLGAVCVPRSAELRFCMKACESGDDCRDDYECRDVELMREHGGEIVPAADKPIDVVDPQPFCAATPL